MHGGLLEYLAPWQEHGWFKADQRCSIRITFQFLPDLLMQRWNLHCKGKVKTMEVFIKQNWIQFVGGPIHRSVIYSRLGATFRVPCHSS